MIYKKIKESNLLLNDEFIMLSNKVNKAEIDIKIIYPKVDELYNGINEGVSTLNSVYNTIYNKESKYDQKMSIKLTV